uniref:Putative defensin n=1 Tax=Rhipicephalus microplus TaxID=6941 RepID=A0A6M2DA93_RHIMP
MSGPSPVFLLILGITIAMINIASTSTWAIDPYGTCKSPGVYVLKKNVWSTHRQVSEHGSELYPNTCMDRLWSSLHLQTFQEWTSRLLDLCEQRYAVTSLRTTGNKYFDM